MFPVLLILGSIVVGYVGANFVYWSASLINKIKGFVTRKENKNDKKSKVTKEIVLEMIENYKNYINSGKNKDGKSIDKIIEDKISSLNFKPGYEKCAYLVTKSLKSLWGSIVVGVNRKIERLMAKVENSDSYDDVFVQVSGLDDYSWFDSEGCNLAIERTVRKYSIYHEEIKHLDLEKFNSNDDLYVWRAVSHIENILGFLEKKIVSSKVSVQDFETEFNREVSNIYKVIGDIEARLESHDLVSDVNKLKENDADLLEKLESIAKEVLKNSEYLSKLSNVDLKILESNINELRKSANLTKKQVDNLLVMFGKEIEIRSKNDQLLRDNLKDMRRFIKDNVAKKKDLEVIIQRLDGIDESLKNLAIKDLFDLKKELSDLRKDFSKVEDEFSKVVDKKISDLEERVKEFAKRSISIRIGKKMKEFEEKTINKIIDVILDKLSNAPIRELTEDELNDIIDKMIDRVEIVRRKKS